ncbi:HAD-IIIC family phosphatase [Actinoplanes sp. KI2]|uniref:HAD-IIIC family phosphatase n=1 Tax=Actinoplanes sp. KI2 TaxID=2983315 RepID=UPI0021D5945B|nr:HAD-IIIC family phosphatase [Actinoplanes sp. KI2]MCU7725983.1 HAD-IIIC family phosphatase [Actinoplanes sp. KI2]
MIEALTQLVRSGAAVAEYPAVRSLLAGVGDDDLPRAGRLLARLEPAEVLDAHPDTPTLAVAVTGHGTVAPMVPMLTAELARHGILARPWVSGFEAYVFDLGDPGSDLYASNPDLVVCLLSAEVVFDAVPTPWTVPDVARLWRENLVLLEALADCFAQNGRGTLVFNTVPLPRRFTAQLVDYPSRAELGAVWREANARLLRLGENNPSVVVLDLEPLALDVPMVRDARLSQHAKVHLSPGVLAGYAREIGHLAAHLVGATRKVLALDLDGTVWGGVLADNGVEGIAVGSGYRGAAFTVFQRIVKQLGVQGVVLAAVSKNDPDEVRAALRDHPDLVLREDDFAVVAANWEPKPANLSDLAETLNVRLDSLVFVDDSSFECELVRSHLPEVAVLEVGPEPALHPDRLLSEGWFDVRAITAEDRRRPADYRQERVRRDFLQRFDSIEDYLRELNLRVVLAPMDPGETDRVAQLTLRTNQFNLTHRRMQPADVEQWAADPDGLILTIRAADRFGDSGLVGVFVARRAGDVLCVENFMISCRVFSRGIERACLVALLARAREAGFTAVDGLYRKHPKATVVAELYPAYGFHRLPSRPNDDPEVVTYRHDLRHLPSGATHIKLTVNLEEVVPCDGR